MGKFIYVFIHILNYVICLILKNIYVYIIWTKKTYLPPSRLSYFNPEIHQKGRTTLAQFRPTTFILAVVLLVILAVYFFGTTSNSGLDLHRARFQLTPETKNATMSAGISAIRVSATGTHSATVIWLHGLGDSGRGWSFIGRYYDLPVHLSFRDNAYCSMLG